MNRVLFSSASNHWSTPADVYTALHEEFKFTFDACPLYSIDGLTKQWRGSVFCNPPYSNIKGFLEKGYSEICNGRVTSLVYLLPSRTDTKWFHDYCIGNEIRFLRGRLKFGGAVNNAPFPSMIVILKKIAAHAVLPWQDKYL